MKFLVVWEVWYTDEDIKYHASEYEEAKNLEELIEHLDAGKEEGYFTPELKVPPHDGDFNIEYVLIESEAGELLWKDPDYELDDGPELASEDDNPSEIIKKITDRDRKLALKAVKEDSGALKYADDSLKADREVVLEAVKSVGWALEFASNELQSDSELKKIAEG